VASPSPKADPISTRRRPKRWLSAPASGAESATARVEAVTVRLTTATLA
jgi:hypothetical protein